MKIGKNRISISKIWIIILLTTKTQCYPAINPPFPRPALTDLCSTRLIDISCNIIGF